MSLVILNNEVAVNPAHVVDLAVDGNRVLVRMTDGQVYWLHCEYGKSIFRTRDDIVKRLNGEAE